MAVAISDDYLSPRIARDRKRVTKLPITQSLGTKSTGRFVIHFAVITTINNSSLNLNVGICDWSCPHLPLQRLLHRHKLVPSRCTWLLVSLLAARTEVLGTWHTEGRRSLLSILTDLALDLVDRT